jgi:hypothetical protein
MNPETMNRIRKLVGLNKIEEAIELLGSKMSDKTDIVLLQRRLSELSEQSQRNTISREDADVEMAQIGEDILEILEKKEKNEPSEKAINVNLLHAIVNKVKETQKPYYFVAIALLGLGGGCFVYFLSIDGVLNIEKTVSAFFSILSGVPFNTILKKRGEIVNANLFIALAQANSTPADSVIQAYNKFIMKNLS